MGMRLVAASSVAALVIASARHVRADEGRSSRTPVFVDSDLPHLTLFERTPQGDYVSLCQTPCSIELAPGLFQGAVSRGEKERLEADVLIPRRPVRLQVQLDRGRGGRVVGWVIFGLGLAAGITSLYFLSITALNEPKADLGWLGATGGSLAFSGLGLAMALTVKDSASLVVSPALAARTWRTAPVGPSFRFSF